MICSLFDFCPQPAQSRRRGEAWVGLSPPRQSCKPSNGNMKYYKSVEFLSILRMSSPTAPYKHEVPLFKTF